MWLVLHVRRGRLGNRCRIGSRPVCWRGRSPATWSMRVGVGGSCRPRLRSRRRRPGWGLSREVGTTSAGSRFVCQSSGARNWAHTLTWPPLLRWATRARFTPRVSRTIEDTASTTTPAPYQRRTRAVPAPYERRVAPCRCRLPPREARFRWSPTGYRDHQRATWRRFGMTGRHGRRWCTDRQFVDAAVGWSGSALRGGQREVSVNSAVEVMGPAQVRLMMEVPFEELRPALRPAQRGAEPDHRRRGRTSARRPGTRPTFRRPHRCLPRRRPRRP